MRKRDEIENRYKWRLDRIYPSIEAWEEDFEKMKILQEGLPKFEGKLNITENLNSFYKLKNEVGEISSKLFLFVRMNLDVDGKNSELLEMMSRLDDNDTYISSALSFASNELAGLSKDFVIEAAKQYHLIDLRKRSLLELIDDRERLKSPETEKVLADFARATNDNNEIFKNFNATVKFPSFEANGKTYEVTHATIGRLTNDNNREIRKKAAESRISVYEQNSLWLASNYISAVETYNQYAKLRGFDDPLEFELHDNEIPVDVYKNLIETTHKYLPLVREFLEKRRKKLGIAEEDFKHYDMSKSIYTSAEEDIPYEEGIEICKKGLAPLGEDYLSKFDFGINNGWIDVFENENKRSGAYSWGNFYTQPYILLNYDSTLDSVGTLAHEMGHSINSAYTNENQEYENSGHSIFTAEIASTANEILLAKYLIANEEDNKKHIEAQLENIWGTFFTQVMFAEFELFVHEENFAGRPLTMKIMTDKYYELYKMYNGGYDFDESVGYNWARIPHFYSDFYVYQYATGIAAGCSFANDIYNGKEDAVENYTKFLSAGNSKKPIEILNDAGLDMTKSHVIDNLMTYFKELLEQY